MYQYSTGVLGCQRVIRTAGPFAFYDHTYPKIFFGHFVLEGLLNIRMQEYTHSGYIHYKDLPQLDAAHAGVQVFVDTTAEDTYAYWLERRQSEGLVAGTVDITGLLEGQSAAGAHIADSPRIDVLLKIVVDSHTVDLSEELYHRGPHQVAWDLTAYTEPGIAPIPDHVVSTPELTGLLTIGGAGELAWRCGGFWMDARGHTAGYPRIPGINLASFTEDLWTFSTRDLGELLAQTLPGRTNIWNTYWQQQCQSRSDIIASTDSPYPHTRRFAMEYRRRLGVLRRAVSSREV